jgi:hypothetical protein
MPESRGRHVIQRQARRFARRLPDWSDGHRYTKLTHSFATISAQDVCVCQAFVLPLMDVSHIRAEPMKLTDLVRRLEREWAIADRAFNALGVGPDASLRAPVPSPLPTLVPPRNLPAPRNTGGADTAPAPLSDVDLQADAIAQEPAAAEAMRAGPTVEQLDAVFSAYRSWRAVNANLLEQMERAVHGQAMPWADVDRQFEVLGRLQGEFVSKLKAMPRSAP